MRKTDLASTRARITAGTVASFTRRAVVVAVLTLAGLAIASSGTASAHARLVSSDPAADSVLQEAPKTVTATFNEPLQPEFAAMTVVGPDGNLWSTGTVRVSDATAAVDLLPLGPAGVYTANFRVTSADGHVISGSWPFEVTVASSGMPGPPAAEAAEAAQPEGEAAQPQGQLPVWPFVVVAAVIVGAGAWWAARRRT